MTEEKKQKNLMAELLARKKAMQANNRGQFNPNNGKQGKVSKGFGGPSVTRKTGRGS
jgi:hypothetical protein